ncbi:hypothetical protein I6J22_08895 [Corynebacterium kroppenstedtii]|uniref:Uncharacterized protein n=1 Tax=Corynebacterium kroppenstedtii (strain DSM 44385 / JCM 11950 / CIP 105744 / CCUG 35717) TaxID=645127 RepID=C4LKK0_CORK4|nr:hypothetical protein [Corynebacterium kroppenstedtii]ACR18355.1 hypothetical protein ckrop_1628 [Corynebacterium kroppenstedtii DSM 44385]QRP10303.1 hypothetical protein I6J22_08895 [Corynebacterium kroppenstedtii]
MDEINLDNYESVEERILRFRRDYPNFRCLTKLAYEGDPGQTRWIIKASVWRDAENTGMPDATGYAFELDGAGKTQQTAALETCETSAIGRALANLGYGGNRRVTREEMRKVKRDEDRRLIVSRLKSVPDVGALRALWEDAKAAQVTDQSLWQAFKKRTDELEGGGDGE